MAPRPAILCYIPLSKPNIPSGVHIHYIMRTRREGLGLLRTKMLEDCLHEWPL